MALLLLIAQASPSLAEAAHPGGGVFIPSWVIGLFAGLLVILFGVIGFFLQHLVSEISNGLTNLNKCVEELRETVSREYVSKEFFKMAYDQMKGDNDRAFSDIRFLRKRIDEVASTSESDLSDHERQCPNRQK